MANNCATFEECMLDKRCPFYPECVNNPFGEDDRLATESVPVPVRSAHPRLARIIVEPAKVPAVFCRT